MIPGLHNRTLDQTISEFKVRELDQCRHDFLFTSQIIYVVPYESKHPDRERELEVGVRDCTSLVEYSFYRFLRPRAILTQFQSVS